MSNVIVFEPRKEINPMQRHEILENMGGMIYDGGINKLELIAIKQNTVCVYRQDACVFSSFQVEHLGKYQPEESDELG